MQQGEFFEFDKTTETTQTQAGKALYDSLEAGYHFLDPRDERNSYTKEQIFQDKVADYMDFYEVGFLDDETKAEMTEQEIIANHNQAYGETQEFLARDILGRAIKEDNSEILSLAANHISDIKDVQFQTSESGRQFDSIIEFATYAEAQAGRVELGDRSFDFHASTDTDVMGDVMRIAGEAYGKEEAQQMRIEAFKEHGFVPLRVDHRSSLEGDLTAQMDVSVNGMSGDQRLEFRNMSGEAGNANGYKVRREGAKFDNFLKDVVSHYELDGISRDDLVNRLDDVGTFTDAEDHMRTFLNETKQLDVLNHWKEYQARPMVMQGTEQSIERQAEELKESLEYLASKGIKSEVLEERYQAAQAQANQLSSMISEGGQSDTKAFLNRGEQANDATPDLVKQAGNTKQLDADLKAFEADALKRGVSQENIDGFKNMVREGAGIVQGVHQASQQSNEPSERMKAIEASLVSKGIPQEALDDFKNKVLGNQEGQQAAQNKPVFTKEDSAAFVNAVENTTGGSMQTHEDRLQKNTELAKGQGFAAMHETVEAMKGALKDLSPTDLNPSSKSAFYRARGAANDALDDLYRNNGGISNSPEKMAKLMSRMEGLVEGTFSKNDQGGLQFKFDRGVDARAVASVANSVKDFANDIVRDAKAAQNTAGSDESEYAKAYRAGLQAQKDKNLGLAKDLGGSAVPFAVDAMKDAIKDLSPTGHTKNSANTFYGARKSANEALESMIGLPNGKSAPELNQKTGDLLTRAEDALGGKFSKSDDGRLKFEFNYPVDARLVTSVANKAKGLAEDVVKEAKAERAAQQPATQAPKEAPIETSSTGRITGGGRFSRPPSPEAVAQARQEPPERKRSSGRSL